MASTNLSELLRSPAVIANMAISLTTKGTHIKIRFLGATFPTSAPSGSSDVQLTLYPEKGKKGIVALSISVATTDAKGRERRSDEIPVFLETEWKESEQGEHPFVSLDKPWVSAERIGRVSDQSVEVVIEGTRFSSKDYHKYPNLYAEKQDIKYVPDSGLLCRYLYGEASEDDVTKAAVQQETEKALPERFADLTRQHTAALEHIELLRDECEDLTRRVVLANSVLLEERRLIAELKAKKESVELSLATANNDWMRLAEELMKDELIYRLLKWLPRFLWAKHLSGFVAAMDSINKSPDDSDVSVLSMNTPYL